MRRKCPECRSLWERYFNAELEAFAARDRLESADPQSDPEAAATLRAEAEAATANAAAVRGELAVHRQWHSGSAPSDTGA
jgi:hypothetical protein